MNARSAALAAVRRLLRPLVRLLLHSGVPYRDFAELARRAFVEVATAEFGIRGRPTNVARVAILTGINRRDVARLRAEAAPEADPEPAYLGAAQRVLSAWHQHPGYLDPSGAPRAIPAGGAAPSFAGLCAEHAGGVPATALLKELRAVGCVVAAEGGLWRAAERVYIPRQVDPGKILRAGSVIADVGRTVVHDLVCGPRDALRFERRAENDRIDPRHLPAFRRMLAAEGQAFLERVDDWLTQHEAQCGEAPTVLRLGVGVYHIQDEPRRGVSP